MNSTFDARDPFGDVQLSELDDAHAPPSSPADRHVGDAEADRRVGGERLRAVMSEAARRLSAVKVETFDQDEMLRAIVAGALVAVPDAAAASITLLDQKGAVRTHASSDEAVSAVELLQTELGEGPGIDAQDAASDAATGAPDLSADPPWPAFGRAALDAGFAAVLSFPLRAKAASGAVTLYGASPYCFSAHDELVGSLFAQQATVALAGAGRVGELNRALASRDVIARAKGILMERFRVDDGGAFAMLVESSQHTNMKLHAVASWLIGEAEASYARERSRERAPVSDLTRAPR